MTYDKYIGLPYLANGRTEAGVDCWGLVRLFYRDELNIDLPSYTTSYTGPDDPAIMELMSEYKDTNWKKQTVPKPGDVCVFNIYGEPCHVGVYIGNSKFMHSRENRDVVIESLDSPKWIKRFEGCYTPDTAKQIQVVGAPHPLKTSVYQDWTVAGTTVRDFVNFTKEKYKVSDRLSSRLLVVVDGIKVPVEHWDTTVLQQGQTIAYRSVPEGKDAFRMVLMIALIVVANVYGAEIGAAMGLTEGASMGSAGSGFFEAGTVTTTGKIVGTMAINMAGMALINAVFPIRNSMGSDPGTGRGVNLFTGAGNQANKFGAIPVVLGKVRMTAMLGATPYIETTPDSSLINLLLVWGFGPLSIDENTICVGLTPLSSYYPVNYPADAPKFETLKGNIGEDATKFNKIYPYEIEQKILQIELKNNSTDGNNWGEFRFTKKAESVAVGLTFPEGMREIITTGESAGHINEAVAGIEIQLAKYNPSTPNVALTWNPVSAYSSGHWTGGTPNAREYIHSIKASPNYYYPDSESYISLYQYTIFAMLSTGEIQAYQGAATQSATAEPNSDLQTLYRSGGYPGLISTDGTFSRLPTIPTGAIKLYTICTYGGFIFSNVNNITASGISYTGLAISTETLYTTDNEGNQVGTGYINIVIASGKLYLEPGDAPAPGETRPIFTSRDYNLAGVSATSGNRVWCDLLKNYGVWNTDGATNNINISKIVNFPITGYYYVEASADDYGSMFINGAKLLDIPGYSEPVSGLIYLEEGNYAVQLTATNTSSSTNDRSVACNITYTANAGMNALNAQDSGVILNFGESGFFSKRKDAFNFTYRVGALPHDYYAVRVRRTTNDEAEPTTSARRYFKSILFDVTGYSSRDDAGNQVPPIIDPPGCKLAKTAIRIQSSNKVNGSVDGVNAIVQTMAPMWINSTQTWSFSLLQPTNNPASLFIYVLLHPANAYKVEDTIISHSGGPYANYLDLATLGSWYQFCNGNNVKGINFTYNDVITGTKSVMEVLRDIAAAGMASPAFVDGKWSVIIDRPRDYTSQYFTTHNSWGFESTKLLPKIPDGFRVAYPNEDKAYQVDEIIVYNYGKNNTNAKVFESISLPGITNTEQVKFFAKWHLAQLKLRPEVYTLNTDFEYLVCTRGDLVKVTHDVPRWGTSSGRISSIVSTTVLNLSESVYLESGKTYTILIRTNNVDSSTKVLQSITRNLTAITTSAEYNQITLTSPILTTDNLESDNLYMLGEVGHETQQLVIVSIEPMSNISAKLTLVDYAPSIYTLDATKDLLVFDANITGETIPLILNTIQTYPNITGTSSDAPRSEQISNGIYQNVLLVSYTHPSDLSKNAEKIEVQVVSASTEFIDNSLEGITTVNKETSGATITGLVTGGLYKIRARYTNAARTIVGPWSPTYYAKNVGKNINRDFVNAVEMHLSGTYITANVSQDFIKPANFKTFEYRFKKDSGTIDFWDFDPIANNIIIVQGLSDVSINLIDVPAPRLSDGGITYRVACRALDNNNNYSTTSAFGEVVVTTIT